MVRLKENAQKDFAARRVKKRPPEGWHRLPPETVLRFLITLHLFSGNSLDGSSAEECGGRELRGAGPAGDIKRGIGMRAGVVAIDVMVREGLVDALTGGILLGSRGTLPKEKKTLSANGAVNIGRAVGRLTKDLHRSFPHLVGSGYRLFFRPDFIIYNRRGFPKREGRPGLQPMWYVVCWLVRS